MQSITFRFMNWLEIKYMKIWKISYNEKKIFGEL